MAASYEGSKADQAARTQGRHVVRELAFDVDGDGRAETAIVERKGERLTPVLFRREGAAKAPTFVEILRGSSAPATRVERFEARPMCGSLAIVAVLESSSPDERELSMRILGMDRGAPKELFVRTFFVPKTAGAVDGVRAPATAPHYGFVQTDGDCERVVFVHGPQILNVPGRDRLESIVIGAYRSVFAYDSGEGRFVVLREREVVDHAPSRPPRDVTATAQVPRIWGTAQAFWATDGRLDTAWSVRSRRARGQRLSVRFAEPVAISMVRVVPGCGTDRATWERHDRIRAFSLSLGEGRRFDIDRKALKRIPRGVRAIGEFPLASGYGRQVIVVLEGGAPVLSADFEIRAVVRTSGFEGVRTAEVCLSEVSFH